MRSSLFLVDLRRLQARLLGVNDGENSSEGEGEKGRELASYVFANYMTGLSTVTLNGSLMA